MNLSIYDTRGSSLCMFLVYHGLQQILHGRADIFITLITAVISTAVYTFLVEMICDREEARQRVYIITMGLLLINLFCG